MQQLRLSVTWRSLQMRVATTFLQTWPAFQSPRRLRDLFSNRKFVSFHPFAYLLRRPPPPLWQPCFFPDFMSSFLGFFCGLHILWILHVSEIVCSLSLSDLFHFA